MVIRQRAIHREDKEERHHAILDAAERLLERAPNRFANVAEVADAAGLAKGTVYLYFPSKDELLLALHERHVETFFSALIALLAGPAPLTIGDMLDLTAAHIVGRPTFLPLATRCFGIVETEVPTAVADAFRQRMAVRLGTAGAGLERRFPQLGEGGGVSLLRHSYALIVGLWQMTGKGPPEGESCAMPVLAYPQELERALRALWKGAVGLADEAAAGAAANDLLPGSAS